MNWALNSRINSSGYSASQWVLGRGLSLPYDLLSSSSQLSLQTRVMEDRSFADRISLLSSARRASLALRYQRGLSRAFLARSRVTSAIPADHVFSDGDQVFYWRGRAKRKQDCSQRWVGPGVVIGHEQNSWWISHRNTTVKCLRDMSASPSRRSVPPWSQVLDEVTIRMGSDVQPIVPRDDSFLNLTTDGRPGDLPWHRGDEPDVLQDGPVGGDEDGGRHDEDRHNEKRRRVHDLAPVPSASGSGSSGSGIPWGRDEAAAARHAEEAAARRRNEEAAEARRRLEEDAAAARAETASGQPSDGSDNSPEEEQDHDMEDSRPDPRGTEEPPAAGAGDAPMSPATVRRELSGGEQPSPFRRRIRDQLLDDLPLAVRGQPGISTSDGAAGGDRKRFTLDDLPVSVRRRLAAKCTTSSWVALTTPGPACTSPGSRQRGHEAGVGRLHGVQGRVAYDSHGATARVMKRDPQPHMSSTPGGS